MVIAAHPADEVLGCGGAIVRHAFAGDEVHILIMGEGVTSRDAVRNRNSRLRELSALRKQSREACKILGADAVTFHDMPDNRIDSIDLLDLVKIIEDAFAKKLPEIVYTHHGSDLSVDHCIVHRAVMTAARPTPGQSVRKTIAFEIPSSTSWSCASQGKSFSPNYFIDITGSLETKLRAMAAYESELRPWPHPRSLQAVEYMARANGSSVGLEAVERFEIIRMIE